MNYLAVAIGGALGALLRYIISLQLSENASYYTTFMVNIIGCILLGLFWVLADHLQFKETVRLLISVGLLSSLTTFSTFALDIIQLANQNQWLTAALYVAASLIIGVAAMFATIFICKQLISL